MVFNASPSSSASSSASSSPISIGWPSPSSTSSSYSARSISSSSSNMTCAFPSWPTGPSLSPFHTSAPSAFISDADLFPDDLLDDEANVFLDEAPAPPRQVPFPAAMPLLPLYAPEKPKKQQQQQRRRNSNKKRRSSKPMTPISESPEVPE